MTDEKTTGNNTTDDAALSRADFEARLRGMERLYHIHHPFHQAMNNGGIDREAVRGWVANRFYYQIQIPRKDAAILANCPDREVRRLWIQRILDHDGSAGNEGGIEAWLRLAESVGLEREEVSVKVGAVENLLEARIEEDDHGRPAKRLNLQEVVPWLQRFD